MWCLLFTRLILYPCLEKDLGGFFFFFFWLLYWCFVVFVFSVKGPWLTFLFTSPCNILTSPDWNRVMHLTVAVWDFNNQGCTCWLGASLLCLFIHVSVGLFFLIAPQVFCICSCNELMKKELQVAVKPTCFLCSADISLVMGSKPGIFAFG